MEWNRDSVTADEVTYLLLWIVSRESWYHYCGFIIASSVCGDESVVIQIQKQHSYSMNNMKQWFWMIHIKMTRILTSVCFIFTHSIQLSWCLSYHSCFCIVLNGDLRCHFDHSFCIINFYDGYEGLNRGSDTWRNWRTLHFFNKEWYWLIVEMHYRTEMNMNVNWFQWIDLSVLMN